MVRRRNDTIRGKGRTEFQKLRTDPKYIWYRRRVASMECTARSVSFLVTKDDQDSMEVVMGIDSENVRHRS